MFERILIPLDGSELAEAALPYGEEIGKKLGSQVILYHVCNPRHPCREDAHKLYLDGVAKRLALKMTEAKSDKSSANLEVKIEAGDPQESICNLVEKNNVDLIIMTAFGRSGIKVGKMLGSVVDRVCRITPVPVMLIRSNSVQPINVEKQLVNHMLITTDGSDLSKLAFPVGEELAAKLDIPITLFQMANDVYPYGGDASPFIDFEKWGKDEEKKVLVELLSLEQGLKEKKLMVNSVVTRGNDAAKGIIETVKKVGADLLVMSTHGRSGVSRLFFGSVAEKVLKNAEVPLLIVHARAN